MSAGAAAGAGAGAGSARRCSGTGKMIAFSSCATFCVSGYCGGASGGDRPTGVFREDARRPLAQAGALGRRERRPPGRRRRHRRREGRRGHARRGGRGRRRHAAAAARARPRVAAVVVAQGAAGGGGGARARRNCRHARSRSRRRTSASSERRVAVGATASRLRASRPAKARAGPRRSRSPPPGVTASPAPAATPERGARRRSHCLVRLGGALQRRMVSRRCLTRCSAAYTRARSRFSSPSRCRASRWASSPFSLAFAALRRKRRGAGVAALLAHRRRGAVVVPAHLRTTVRVPRAPPVASPPVRRRPRARRRRRPRGLVERGPGHTAPGVLSSAETPATGGREGQRGAVRSRAAQRAASVRRVSSASRPPRGPRPRRSEQSLPRRARGRPRAAPRRRRGGRRRGCSAGSGAGERARGAAAGNPGLGLRACRRRVAGRRRRHEDGGGLLAGRGPMSDSARRQPAPAPLLPAGVSTAVILCTDGAAPKSLRVDMSTNGAACHPSARRRVKSGMSIHVNQIRKNIEKGLRHTQGLRYITPASTSNPARGGPKHLPPPWRHATHPAKDSESRLTSSLLPETERQRHTERQRQHARQRRSTEVAEQHAEQYPKVPDHALETQKGALAAPSPLKPATRRSSRAAGVEVENGKLKSAQCVWDSVGRRSRGSSGRGAPRGDAGRKLRGSGRAAPEAAPRRSTRTTTTSTSRAPARPCWRERRLTRSSRPRVRASRASASSTGGRWRTGPGRRGTRSPADARADGARVTTPPPPPPPSSPLSSQSARRPSSRR